MKIIVRAFVVALAITGCIASTSANGSSAKTSSKMIVKTSAAPDPQTPGCDPSDPKCNFDTM